MAHRVSPQAEAELDAIWYHTATQSSSIEVADRVIDNLTSHFHLLATNPHLGRRRDDDLASGLRSFPVGEYLIFYRVDQIDVLILHVVRGSRDIHALFSRSNT